MGGIFISYRREDSAGWAGRMYDYLSARVGEDQVFIDHATIRPGDNFAEAIEHILDRVDTVLVVIGPTWLEARSEDKQRRLEDPLDHVRREVAGALRRGCRVVPVLVGHAPMPADTELPPDIAGLALRNAVSITDSRFSAEMDALIGGFDEESATSDAPTATGEPPRATTPDAPATPTRTQPRVTELLVKLAHADRWQEQLASRYPMLEAEFTSIVDSVLADHGGSLFQHWGDRVLAVFGHRSGIEGNAYQACQAALAVHDVAKSRENDFVRDFGAPVMAQAFVHSGLVEIEILEGKLEDVRGALSTEIAAIDQESDAQAGETVISATTLELVRESFDTTPLDPITRGGRPIEIHRIDRPRISSRTWRRPDLRVPLIGRRRKLDLLRHHWEAAHSGHGTVVHVTGEAGIGKSRLLEALRPDIEASGGLWLWGAASSIRTDSPFYLFEDLLEVHLRTRGINADDLEEAAGATGIEREWLEPLLGGSGVLQRSMTPSAVRRHIMDELSSWLGRAAAEQPLALVLEDLHWADSSSVELINEIAERAGTLPLLIVATYRPLSEVKRLDGKAGSPGSLHGSRLPKGFSVELDPLPQQYVAELARAVADRFEVSNLPDDLSKSEGNPLYIQEIVRTEGSKLPGSIYEVLAARLDSCGAALSAAQAASVLGVSFANQVLYSMDPELPLREWTETLLDEGIFVAVEGAYGTMTEFSHSLIQEVAYERLDSTRKADLHRVASDQLPPETAIRSPEILARHLQGIWDHSPNRNEDELVRAAEAWLSAGKAASSNSAYQEALNYYQEKAWNLIASVSDEDHRHELEYELHVARATPLTALNGYAAQDVDDAYTRALELAALLGKKEEVFTELRGKAAVHLLRADLTGAREFATKALGIAEDTAEPANLAEAHAWLGTVRFFLGHAAEAESHFEQVAENYDAGWHRTHGPQIELDPLTLARSHHAWLLQQMGEPERALELAKQTTEDSKNLQHPLSHNHSLLYEAGLRVLRDEPGEALETSNEQVTIAEHRLFPHYLYYGQLINLYARARVGETENLDAVVEAMEKALAKRNRETRALLAKPFQLWLIGQIELMRGDKPGAEARFEQARTIARSTGEVWFLDTIEESID